MARSLILYCVAALCLAGCCCSQPLAQRFVPASSVVRMEPPLTTYREFQTAEQQGYAVVAKGDGEAFDALDEPIKIYEGQAVHVLRVDPESGEVVACRHDDRRLIRLHPGDLEVETTTYGR